MYQYDSIDRQLVDERVSQFRDQVERRIAGEISEDEFKPLRLMNGLYLQLHAYMLRVAIPYGILSSGQLRQLAYIAERFDRGYGHFTTRQNIQFNWPKLVETPDILAALAEVDMHAIQTSGNCIRNTTTDQFAGAAADEHADARIYAEMIRQWSTLHPEFSFLPRKFKIALNGAATDRAAVKVHDIGLNLVQDEKNRLGFEVVVGGGLGRTPVIGKIIRGYLPEADLLSYLEAILRVYNLLGRRDNKYKARIKILVNETGVEEFTRLVEAEWQGIKDGPLRLPQAEIDRIRDHFAPPAFEDCEDRVAYPDEADFNRWLDSNVSAHKQTGYAIVTISVKPTGGIPGDMTAAQMRAVADLSDRHSFGEIRVAHEQNLVLPHVRKDRLYAVWRALNDIDLGEANVGLIGDIIACPGLDYCALANARSIPVAQEISRRFNDIARQHDVGALSLNISGCINACGHHHVANIGILGVDKRGKEYYQITLGGRADQLAAIGQIIGRAFSADEVADAVETIVETYLSERAADESFIDTYSRIGQDPFKEALYGTD
jgi:sulfite reductase (NADPH) hemoprotein beta-component